MGCARLRTRWAFGSRERNVDRLPHSPDLLTPQRRVRVGCSPAFVDKVGLPLLSRFVATRGPQAEAVEAGKGREVSFPRRIATAMRGLA